MSKTHELINHFRNRELKVKQRNGFACYNDINCIEWESAFHGLLQINKQLESVS